MRQYLARLKELDETEIVAGHMGSNAEEPHPSGGGAVTKAQVARFVQHGTRHMRARPFMDLAAQDLQSDTELAILNKEARSPDAKKSVKNALKPLGRRAARAVRDAIVTLDAVDTGTTRDAVRYQIRRGGRVLHEGGAS